MQAKDGVIVAVEEKSRDLQVEDITQKIFQVDDHIGIAAAGYIPDARILVDSARFFSQSNKLTYDESVEIETVAKHLADPVSQAKTGALPETPRCYCGRGRQYQDGYPQIQNCPGSRKYG